MWGRGRGERDLVQIRTVIVRRRCRKDRPRVFVDFPREFLSGKVLLYSNSQLTVVHGQSFAGFSAVANYDH